MESSERENPWDRSLRGVNGVFEGVARRIPIYRSLRRAFEQGSELINWEQAEELAILVATSDPVDVQPPGPGEQAELEQMMLRSEELVTVEREGTFLRYRANAAALQQLLGFLYAECCTRSKVVKAGAVLKCC